MDYEKAYKDALNKAKSKIWNDNGHVLYEDDIKEIFPELAESEDEKIRKWIRKELESKYVVDNIVNNRTADKAFAWLEKQGKNKPVWSKEDEKNLNTIINVIHGGTHLAYENETDWLKSLKYRIKGE